MSTQAQGLAVAFKNAGDALSRIQVEDGALSQITTDLQRIRELEVQRQNGILTETDRQAIEAEQVQLSEGIKENLEQTHFNGKPVFDSQEQAFQVGANAGQTISLSESDLLAKFEQSNVHLNENLSIEQIDDALAVATNRRTQLGAVSNRVQSTQERVMLERELTLVAESAIRDVDIADAVSKKTQADVQVQVGISVQAQANLSRSNVITLLND